MRDGAFYSSLDFFVFLPTKTYMAFTVSNDYISLETSTLSGASLFLDWFNLHHFFLEFVFKQMINNFEFFDGNGESEDFFDGFNFS